MLTEELKIAILTKVRGLLSRSVALLHDNLHPQTVAYIVDTLEKIYFEVLKHMLHRILIFSHQTRPLWSSERSPRRKNTSDEDVPTAAQTRLAGQTKNISYS